MTRSIGAEDATRQVDIQATSGKLLKFLVGLGEIGSINMKQIPGGRALQFWLLNGLILASVGAIALPAMGEMMFGFLGVTPEDSSWKLVLLIWTVWSAIAGRLPAELYLRKLTVSARLQGANQSRKHWQMQMAWQWTYGGIWLSRIAAGLLLGFFYGGRWTGNAVWGAIAGAAFGIGLAAVWGNWLSQRQPELERSTGLAIAVCAAYGLWLWFGAWGLAAGLAQRWGITLLYALTAFGFARCAWLSLCELFHPN